MDGEDEKPPRRLECKAEGSHPEAPDRQVKKQSGSGEEEPGWVKKLMEKMDGVEGKVDGMTVKVDSAVKEAFEAKEGMKKIETK